MPGVIYPADFVHIPAGSFVMGAKDIENASPPHDVTISKPFLLSQYPVVNYEFDLFMEDSGIAPVTKRYERLSEDFFGATKLAVGISYDMACAYTDWLTKRYQKSDKVFGEGHFGLPTEAQWEYAARAGRSEAEASYSTMNGQRGSAFYQDFGHLNLPLDDPMRGVISFTAYYDQLDRNPWGLHGMTGSAFEWVNDFYGAYTLVAQVDPQGMSSGRVRVQRGGSVHVGDSESKLGRIAYRRGSVPSSDSFQNGMRVGFFPRT